MVARQGTGRRPDETPPWERFEVRRSLAAARAADLSPLRRELAALAERCGLRGEEACDVALASYEAMANAVEHAYLGHGGRLDIQGAFDPAAHTFTVTVTDEGHWRTPTVDPHSTRGHGLTLMRSLTSVSEVTTGQSGTRVRLQWTVPSERPAPGAPPRP